MSHQLYKPTFDHPAYNGLAKEWEKFLNGRRFKVFGVHPGRAFTFATIKQLSTSDNDGIAVISKGHPFSSLPYNCQHSQGVVTYCVLIELSARLKFQFALPAI